MKTLDKKIFEMHAELCKTFTSPRRLEILNMLRNGEKTVSELLKLADISQTNLSQHLAILRQRGVVATRKEGTNIYYKIADPKIIQACDLMRSVLLEQLGEGEKLAKVMKKR